MASYSTSKTVILTPRQREIYEFVKENIMNRGYGPTVRQIGNEFGIKSPNGVMCHLKALEKKGLIVREDKLARAIQLRDRPRKAHLPRSLNVQATDSRESIERIWKSFADQDWLQHFTCCGPWQIQLTPRMLEYFANQAGLAQSLPDVIVRLPNPLGFDECAMNRPVFVMTYPSGSARSLWTEWRDGAAGKELVIRDGLALLDPDDANPSGTDGMKRWITALRSPYQEPIR